MAGKVSISNEAWQEDVRVLGNGEFTCTSMYAGSNTLVEFRHSCGEVFKKTPHEWKRRPTCPRCNPPGRKAGTPWRAAYTASEFQKLLDDTHGAGEITLVSDYVSISTPATFRHRCGHEWSAQCSNLVKRHGATGCPVCANTRRSLGHEEFVRRVASMVDGSDYEVIGKYLGAHKGIDILHVSCGHVFRPSPTNFVAGTRCPSCSSATNSSHVRAVATGLESVLPFFGISEYAKEHAFPDGPVTPNGSPLRFDIWIEELQLAIEVDGEFHDRPHYADPHPEETMQRLRASEQLRHQYAEHAGFRLARIRWDEKDLACRAIQIVLDRAKELEYVAFADFAASA